MLKSSVEASYLCDLPLCRQYLHVHVGLVLASEGDQRSGAHGVHWALGLTMDGERELLGAWTAAPTAEHDLSWICDALSARGVERVSLVSTAGPAYAGSGSTHAQIGAGPTHRDGRYALTWGAEIRSPPMPYPLASTNRLAARQRDRLAAVLNDAASMQRDIQQALRRHGSFDTAESASQFKGKKRSRDPP